MFYKLFLQTFNRKGTDYKNKQFACRLEHDMVRQPTPQFTKVKQAFEVRPDNVDLL